MLIIFMELPAFVQPARARQSWKVSWRASINAVRRSGEIPASIELGPRVVGYRLRLRGFRARPIVRPKSIAGLASALNSQGQGWLRG